MTPNIKRKTNAITTTFINAVMEITREFKDNLRPSFLLITLSGLSTLNTLNTLITLNPNLPKAYDMIYNIIHNDYVFYCDNDYEEIKNIPIGSQIASLSVE
jgi:hypothetical protein